jgi:hypothetical protein
MSAECASAFPPYAAGLGAGQGLFAHEALQSRCSEHPPRKTQTADDRTQIAFLRRSDR